jgi:hypothetical protein
VKSGIVMTSRDRTEILPRVLPQWKEQSLPIAILTERDQVPKYQEAVGPDVRVIAPVKMDMGIGYARWCAVAHARLKGWDTFIMADDDVYPKGDVGVLLDFVAKKKAMGCAGWMPNYGLWIPNGNQIAKEPNLVVPMTGGPDRIFALNTAEVLRAGNFNRSLDIRYENAEINRQGIKIGYLWYVHSGVHIKMVNRPYDVGGIVAYAGSVEARKAREKRCHEVIYKVWGDKYITHPSKRYGCKWKKLIEDFIGADAVEAVVSHRVTKDSEIRGR